ncbi:hypothetical protein ACWEN3_12235 [Streptomyces sp. NPDC004561]
MRRWRPRRPGGYHQAGQHTEPQARILQHTINTLYTDKHALDHGHVPRSAQQAVFVLYHLYDRDTDSYPVPHYSASFARSALKAFAEHEAQRRGCTDVRSTT